MRSSNGADAHASCRSVGISFAMNMRDESNRASLVMNGALKLSSGTTVRHGVVDDAVRHDTTLAAASSSSSVLGHTLSFVFGWRHARCAPIGSHSSSSAACDAGASGRLLARWRVTANGRRSRASPAGRNGGGVDVAGRASSSPAASSAGASTRRTPTRTRRYPANAGGNASPSTASASYTRSANDSDPRTSDASSIVVDATSDFAPPSSSSPASPPVFERVNVTTSRAPVRAIVRTVSSFTTSSCVGPVHESHGTTPAARRATTSGWSPCVETNSVPSGRA
mmetsp:Transcript_3353/g.14674  ORF Transcript_3353/g.14674 Transcript_3353/m.14674 type:complete len:282 (-) Transcript_3353:75-920(-)